jgi:hypothetical protein
LQHRIAVLAVSLALLGGAGVAQGAAPQAVHPSAVAKTCSSGYRHAVIGGAQKCLRAGEFCKRSLDAQYRKYGYRCVRFDAKTSRYRLTHG